MGWTILYIAFGIVALWLLSEVLLQYKARLRWRLLAFVGFLGVVIGVVLPSIVVIAIGAAAFAVGQTYVTLSFRRGFTTGWALAAGRPKVSRRRRGGGRAAAAPEAEGAGPEPGPVTGDGAHDPQESAADHGAADDQGNGYGYAPDAAASPYADAYAARQDGYADPYAADATQAAPVYAPEPMPDDTGQYGIYSTDARTGQQPHDPYGGGYYEPAAAYDAQAGHYGGYGDGQPGSGYADPYAAQDPYGGAYDPYAQPGSYPPADPYGGHDQYGGHDPYGYGGQVPQQYGGGYDDQYYGGAGPETPPGGVWVPQQRAADEQQPYPPAPQPDHQGYGYPPQQGYDEQQYRY
ncbi:hypothetical protein C3486_35825 [Streptomyces sp. Ru73]|uniref:hypothetical protein n=1 Tax=Streptomyces sp. Ru73 TaxID=2080748 RepID=UPI000CDDF925|nr:hypothetical protein [Streptomyces sp. Ru73]POX36007.1 hypothetical protein C3486_35825 [Streptomyces sp. Ru73]